MGKHNRLNRQTFNLASTAGTNGISAASSDA